VDHARFCDLLVAQIERVSEVVDEIPGDAPVPTCPDWRVADLLLHLGRVHRWADELVRTLADGPKAAAAAFADPGPPTGAWLRQGGAALVATLRAADPDAPMWAWGADQHVRFWSRRQLHETLVHRIDAELAGGIAPAADASVAADGIDEFLANLHSAERFSPRVANLRGRGERLAITADDVQRSWTVALEGDGFSVTTGHDEAGAALSGGALELLLVLYRRRTLEHAAVAVTGTRDLATFWLANSALE
jgi:uncharacterized protein (TIGR03083 family)